MSYPVLPPSPNNSIKGGCPSEAAQSNWVSRLPASVENCGHLRSVRARKKNPIRVGVGPNSDNDLCDLLSGFREPVEGSGSDCLGKKCQPALLARRSNSIYIGNIKTIDPVNSTPFPTVLPQQFCANPQTHLLPNLPSPPLYFIYVVFSQEFCGTNFSPRTL